MPGRLKETAVATAKGSPIDVDVNSARIADRGKRGR